MLDNFRMRSRFIESKISNGEIGDEKSKILVRFPISSPNSINSLEWNSSSFHKVLSDSLRCSFVNLLDKVLNNEIGTEVKLTLKFKLMSIASDGSVKPVGTISENFKSDPSMRYYISVLIPRVE